MNRLKVIVFPATHDTVVLLEIHMNVRLPGFRLADIIRMFLSSTLLTRFPQEMFFV